MVLGIIIIGTILIIIALIIIRLIQNSNKEGFSGNTKQCMVCGRKTNSLVCKFCKKNLKSLK